MSEVQITCPLILHHGTLLELVSYVLIYIYFYSLVVAVCWYGIKIFHLKKLKLSLTMYFRLADMVTVALVVMGFASFLWILISVPVVYEKFAQDRFVRDATKPIEVPQNEVAGYVTFAKSIAYKINTLELKGRDNYLDNLKGFFDDKAFAAFKNDFYTPDFQALFIKSGANIKCDSVDVLKVVPVHDGLDVFMLCHKTISKGKQVISSPFELNLIVKKTLAGYLITWPSKIIG